MLMRMIRFAGINLVLMPTNVAFATFLTYLGMNYLLATFFGLVLQVVLAFFWLRKVVFKRLDLHAAPGITRAFMVESIGFMIVLAVVYVCVESFGWTFLPSRIVSVLCVALWDYTMHSFFTFKTWPFS